MLALKAAFPSPTALLSTYNIKSDSIYRPLQSAMLPLCSWAEDESSCPSWSCSQVPSPFSFLLSFNPPVIPLPIHLSPTMLLPPPPPVPDSILTSGPVLPYMSILKLTPHSVLTFSLVPGRCFTPIGELNKWMMSKMNFCGLEYVVVMSSATRRKSHLLWVGVSPRKICWGLYPQGPQNMALLGDGRCNQLR